MDDIVMLSATELLAGFRQRSLSPVEVMCAVLDRLTRLDPIVNAFCAVDEETAMSRAVRLMAYRYRSRISSR
jgi:aspartyl-tRNA(Asn)/glutamyl-tRNA(Gln) amidotransferase subunit A